MVPAITFMTYDPSRGLFVFIKKYFCSEQSDEQRLRKNQFDA